MLLFEKPVDHSLKLGNGSSPHQGAAVDEKRRRAGNPEREAIVKVFGHFFAIASCIQTGRKGVRLKSQFLRQSRKVPSLPWGLSVKQDVVVLPKPALLSRALGSFSGLWRIGVLGPG